MYAILQNNYIKAIADAIRSKGGYPSSTKYKPTEMPSAILDLPITTIDGSQIIQNLVHGTLTEFINSSVVMIKDGTFMSSTRLTTVNCSRAMTAGVESFKGCTALEHVYLDAAIQVADSCFEGCTALEEISLPLVMRLRASCFKGCTALEKASFPAINDLVQSSCMQNCTSLKKVNIGNATTIQSKAFSGCSALETLVITKNDGVCGLSYIDAFENCSGVIVYVPRAYVSQYRSLTNWIATGFTFAALEDHPDIIDLW